MCELNLFKTLSHIINKNQDSSRTVLRWPTIQRAKHLFCLPSRRQENDHKSRRVESIWALVVALRHFCFLDSQRSEFLPPRPLSCSHLSSLLTVPRTARTIFFIRTSEPLTLHFFPPLPLCSPPTTSRSPREVHHSKMGCSTLTPQSSFVVNLSFSLH